MRPDVGSKRSQVFSKVAQTFVTAVFTKTYPFQPSPKGCANIWATFVIKFVPKNF